MQWNWTNNNKTCTTHSESPSNAMLASKLPILSNCDASLFLFSDHEQHPNHVSVPGRFMYCSSYFCHFLIFITPCHRVCFPRTLYRHGISYMHLSLSPHNASALHPNSLSIFARWALWNIRAMESAVSPPQYRRTWRRIHRTYLWKVWKVWEPLRSGCSVEYTQ
jgi:hypothetical protein